MKYGRSWLTVVKMMKKLSQKYSIHEKKIMIEGKNDFQVKIENNDALNISLKALFDWNNKNSMIPLK